MLWINEGFVLDDAGNMIMTSYIDLREKDKRTPILSLVKGCRREHAIEDTKTLLISNPARFREYGEALILDEQEGLAKEELVTISAETPAEAAERRAIADTNDALQLLNPKTTIVRRIERSGEKTQRKSITFGKDWWIYCTSIRPDDGEWDDWKATLDEDYDHVSEIGQPAKFAHALARMVTEQIGPLGSDASLTGTSDGEIGARTKHKHQWVIHGPVVYTDRLYDILDAEDDEIRRMALSLFAKRTTHEAQREYRFAVLNGGAEDETVLLKISEMMRDALPLTEGGLIRPTPEPEDMIGEDGLALPRGLKSSTTPKYKRVTKKQRQVERKESRMETRTPDGQVISSDVKQEESVKESVATQEIDLDEQASQGLRLTEEGGRLDAGEPALESEHDSEVRNGQDNEEDVANEISLEEREWNDEPQGDEITIPVVHRGSGRTFKSFKEMFNDPTAPSNPSTKTWEVSACSPDEIVKSYGALATLAWKIDRVAVEHQQQAASACWHALQCIINIYARFGEIIDSVWIERERFVVIHIKNSEELDATGRIVITPSGGYAYYFKSSKSEHIGHSEGHLGNLFFPLGNDVESFESFGWPPKES